MRRRALTTAIAGVATLSLLTAAPVSADDRGNRGNRGGGFQVDTTADTVDARPGDGRCADEAGRCSLRAAVMEANASGGADRITVPGGTYVLTIENAAGDEEDARTGDLDVRSPITIDAKGATVDAGGIDRAFEVLAGASLDVRGLAVTGGFVGGDPDPAAPVDVVVGSGGAFANAGTLSLEGVDLFGNRAEGPGASGGAVLSTGTLTVSRSTIRDNTATRAGGGIEANGGSTTVERSVLDANETGPTPGNGGGLHLTGTGTVLVSRSTVTDNVAASEGGGLWSSATGTMTVERTVLTGNIAAGTAADNGGGALFNDGGDLTVERSELVGNRATGTSGSGGGILSVDGALVVERTLIADGSARRAGGGIEVIAGTVRIERSELVGNATGPMPGNGGALHVTGAATVDVVRTSVRDNTATAEGGGLWNSATGTMTVERSDLVGNVADGNDADQGGGALFNDGNATTGGTLRVLDSTIVDNEATGTSGSGGGILNDEGTLTVERTRIAGNTSVRAGGGVEANVGSTTLTAVELLDNRTGPNPGNGGGLHLTGAGRVDIDDSVVTGNVAAAEGGGLWNSETGTMIVTGTEVSGNTAPTGPNAYNDGGTFILNGEPVPAGDPGV